MIGTDCSVYGEAWRPEDTDADDDNPTGFVDVFVNQANDTVFVRGIKIADLRWSSELSEELGEEPHDQWVAELYHSTKRSDDEVSDYNQRFFADTHQDLARQVAEWFGIA